MWTQFIYTDCSGNLGYDPCEVWIEAPEDIAISLFKIIFSRNPTSNFCYECGCSEWSISERDKLEPKFDNAFIFYLKHITQFYDAVYRDCKTHDERIRVKDVLIYNRIVLL